MKKALILIAAACVLASCATFDRFANWQTDPNAPSWAVDFGDITSINTQAVLNNQRWYWTADRVIAVIGRKALGAAWLNKGKTEFALTYRTDALLYPYCSIIFRWTNRGQFYGYIDFDIHKTNLALRAAVAKGEMATLAAQRRLHIEKPGKKGGI